jgi:hypothetical protein
MARIVTGTASCRDLASLRQGAEKLPEIKRRLSGLSKLRCSDAVRKARHARRSAGAHRPGHRGRAALHVREGGFIREGFDSERWTGFATSRPAARARSQPSRRRKEKTGIRNLRVGYNHVFGYYIEVSKGRSPWCPKRTSASRRSQLRAIHHPGAQGTRKHHSHRVRPRRRAGVRAVQKVREQIASQAPRVQRLRRRRGAGCAVQLRFGRGQIPLLPAGDRPLRAKSPSPTAVTRLSSRFSRIRSSSRTTRPPRRGRLPRGDHHRPEHGGQIDLHAPGGADRPHGADGQLRSGQVRAHRHRGQALHAHRRFRRPGRGTVHLHGGDDRGGRYPEKRHAPLASHSRRDRPRHLDLRRHGHRARGARVRRRPQKARREDALRHALP